MGILDDLEKQVLESGTQAVTGGQTNELAQELMKLLNLGLLGAHFGGATGGR